MRLKDQPPTERPRERLIAHGPDALSSAELLAILLRAGYKGKTAVDVGRELLAGFGSLDALSRATVDDLKVVKGVGRDKAVTLVAAFAVAKKIAEERRHHSPVLNRPDEVVRLVRAENWLKPVETFQVLLLNTRKRLIRCEEIATGTLDTLLVHPREVFRAAIAANAAEVIFVHNHPSGDPTPSEADIRITRELIRAGQLLKIEVVDHIIIGRPSADRQKDYVSLREQGYFT